MRFIAMLFLAIVAIDRASWMFLARRTIDGTGSAIERRHGPMGHWAVAAFWIACAAAYVCLLAVVTYNAIAAEGPFTAHRLFAMELWPTGAIAAVLGVMAALAVRRWVGVARKRRAAG